MTGIVFVSGAAADPRLRLGGLTLLERALIVAARAGVRRCLVAGVASPPRGDLRLPRVTPVADLDDALAILSSEGATEATRILCLHAGVVSTPESLTRFIAASSAEPPAALTSVPVAVSAVGDLRGIWPRMIASKGEGPEVQAAELRQVPGGFFAWVREPRQAAEVERRLLLGLDSSGDGRVDSLFNRRLSRRISRVLLSLPLTPNHVTVLSFVVCLFAAWCFARGTYGASLLGAVLFQLGAVLDCCDGEVARVKFLESPFGNALDVTLDAVGNLAVFVAIAHGAWVSGRLPDVPLLLWLIVVGSLTTFAVVTWGEHLLREEPATREHRLAARLIRGLTTRDFSVLLFAAALTSTLPWFVRGVAFGANVFWLVLAFLLVRGRR